MVPVFFFFNDTAPTEIYTLSLHDALPISERALHRLEHLGSAMPSGGRHQDPGGVAVERRVVDDRRRHRLDRKSTRLNSSHSQISYAVFCLKKKKTLPISLNSLLTYPLTHA